MRLCNSISNGNAAPSLMNSLDGAKYVDTLLLVTSRDQTAGRSHNIKTDNSSFERVEDFKYLGTTLATQILFRKKLRAD